MLTTATSSVMRWHLECCVQNSAQRAMVESQKMFEDMIRSIERMRSEVTKLIGINEKAAFNQAEALIERLEQEIDELKKKESGLKQLYSTEDHIHFLQVTYTLRLYVIWWCHKTQETVSWQSNTVTFMCCYHDVAFLFWFGPKTTQYTHECGF